MGVAHRCAAICMQRQLVSLIKGNTLQLSVAASRHTQLSDKPQENCEDVNVVEMPKHKLSLMSALAQKVGRVKPRRKRGVGGEERGHEAPVVGNSYPPTQPEEQDLTLVHDLTRRQALKSERLDSVKHHRACSLV